MTITEFYGSEPVTAVINLEADTGEAVSAPIVIGHYGPNGGGEIWLDQGGHRVQCMPAHFKDLMKQLKRAHRIAQDMKEAE